MTERRRKKAADGDASAIAGSNDSSGIDNTLKRRDADPAATKLHNEHYANSANNTVSTSTSGAIFIAAFAYYETGGFTRGNGDRPYLVLMMGALVFGLVAGGVFVYHGQVAWIPGLILGAAAVVGSLLGVRFALSVPVCLYASRMAWKDGMLWSGLPARCTHSVSK